MTAKQSDNDVNSREYWERAVSNPKEYGFSDRHVQAMSESLMLTDPDYWKKVMADPEAYGFNANQATQLAKCGMETLHELNHERTQLTPTEKIEEEAGHHIGFYGDKHVQTWLTMGAVSPQEAALLFFSKNPFEYKDRLPFMGDEFDSMKRSFEDAARDGLNRNLRDWIAVACDRNLHRVGIDGWAACITVSAQRLENAYARGLQSEIWRTELEMEKWEKMNDGGIPGQLLIKENALASPRDRLGKLKKLYELPAFPVKDWKTLTDADLDKAILDAAHADTQPPAAPDVTESASGGVEPAKAGPLPIVDGLLTKDIARVFSDLYGWDEGRWTKNLSASQWLHDARIGRGAQGGASALWNPLLLAQLIHGKEKNEKAKVKLLTTLNSRFTLMPALSPWKDAFNEYFATYCPVD